ncbi:MAG: TIGR03564 family F420-dependent LLM class oxidoreductase [Chloroflexi bacterium]|nr:TIGR03564 family F420-dependent LLM class oxidoreductase [Chloroflexota bacterium]
MRIGLMLGDILGPSTVQEQMQQAVDAENDGFDTAWFGQLMGVDALTIVALAGTRTSRIELGTGVMPTFPRHPYVMAQQALTAQAATNNRSVLGLGVSHQIVIDTMLGLSYAHPARHMREYLSVLRPLISSGRIGFQGETYRVNAGLNVPGAQPMPVMIAALAPQMLKIAGELADGTMLWMSGLKTIETHVMPKITAAAKDAGRPAPRIGAGVPVCVTEDVAAGREAASKVFQVYGQLPNYRRMLDREGAAAPGDVAVVGDEAAVERQIRAFASVGVTDLVAPIFPTGPDAAASVARTRALLKSLVGKV